jgi:hypothetical protein
VDKQGDVTITVIGAFCRCVPLVQSQDGKVD